LRQPPSKPSQRFSSKMKFLCEYPQKQDTAFDLGLELSPKFGAYRCAISLSLHGRYYVTAGLQREVGAKSKKQLTG